MASGSSGRYTEMLKVIMRSESLDELPEVSVNPERTSFFSKVLQAESLPIDEAALRGKRLKGTSGLLAFETLPFDERPDLRGGRTSFFSTLFSRESLPEDPIPGPGPAGRGHGR